METRELKERPRQLLARERAILDFLLSIDAPGVPELRAQIEHALAASWSCGCASIDLVIDRDCAAPSELAISPAIESTTRDQSDPERLFDLLLWVDDGYLAGVEIVDYGQEHGRNSAEFPAPADFQPPRLRSDA